MKNTTYILIQALLQWHYSYGYMNKGQENMVPAQRKHLATLLREGRKERGHREVANIIIGDSFYTS